MDNTETNANAYQAIRILLTTLISSLFILLLATSLILPKEVSDPETLAAMAFGLVGYGLVMVYLVFPRLPRPKAVDPSTPAAKLELEAVMQLQPVIILRFALSEAAAIMAIALSFVFYGVGLAGFIVGLAVALWMTWVSWFPRRGVFDEYEKDLNAKGAVTGASKGISYF